MNTSREVCWDLPSHPQAVGKARQIVGEVLDAWSMSALADEVIMVVSELVTNAVVHARAPIVLTLYRCGGIVRGEVADDSPMWPILLPADPDGEHGRGLAIVDAYADRWGVEPAAGGKTVWFVCAGGGRRSR
ncbi:ATP-binding protein [Streptosporangium soli]|nr:ATP-binding protein [Streptosporangium sp. KLBMP 9127]